ncbi:type II and III secretion system protein [Endothiovibrio diazotrophicus]
MEARLGVLGLVMALAAGGCAGTGARPVPASPPAVAQAAPPPARLAPPASEPSPAPLPDPLPPPADGAAPLARYSVAVEGVAVRELLFALARDAHLNLDLHPAVEGTVTLTAEEQTLPRILDRIARQLDLRYRLDGEDLVLEPDTPFVRHYRVDHLNMSRSAEGSVGVATRIATTGSGTPSARGASGGDNNSTTALTDRSDNRFWERLGEGLRALVGEGGEIYLHPEGGVVTVRASAARQREVAALLDALDAGVGRQVLIEATVVEVELSDDYQAGVDWQRLGGDSGASLGLEQSLTAGRLGAAPLFSAALDLGRALDLTATLRLLERFGRLRVLSRPRLTVMNNQTALLKVVDNRVYFTTEVEEEANDQGITVRRSYRTTVHTVPVGLVMSVTPQIGEDRTVTLNIRPTLSRILRFVPDPSPPLAEAGVTSLVPEVQVRELELVLKVASGRVAVLGGLMRESLERGRDGVPGLHSLPLIGDLFAYRADHRSKSELVILLRPLVVGAT